MLRREMIRMALLAFLGMCLAFFLYAHCHDWRSFFMVVYLPCITYGGIAVLKWLWGLFKWFMQMQFLSIVHRSIMGIVFAVIGLVVGSALVMSGGMLYGLYRIIRNFIEDAQMDQTLAMDGRRYLQELNQNGRNLVNEQAGFRQIEQQMEFPKEYDT